MLKQVVSNFIRSTTPATRNQLFQCRFLGDEFKDSFRLTSYGGFSTATNISAGSDGKSSPRVFADYKIYKGKASLSASPRLPTFSKLDSGSLKVDRSGSIMLTFCPAIGERKYDHEKKQMFALNPTEVGSVISLGPGESCEFFHDPSLKSSNAGQVRKSLSIKAQAQSGYFFTLTVANNILKTNDRFMVPVTTAEFAVLREAFSFALPHILGWNHFTNPAALGSNEGNRGKHPSELVDSEWER